MGLGESLLEAENIEDQESPVNCYRKLFGKNIHFIGILKGRTWLWFDICKTIKVFYGDFNYPYIGETLSGLSLLK